MSGLDLAVAHAVKIALVVLLAGMIRRGQFRQCWSFGIYVIAVLLGNTLVSVWPKHLWTPWFWMAKQAVYDVLKLAIALELLYRTVRAFPGTWRAARLVMLALLTASSFALAALTPRSSYRTIWEWQPSVVTAAIWLLTGVALLVVWYRVPVPGWPRVILLGFAPYLLVFLIFVDVVRRHGWKANTLLGVVDSLAYLALVLFWSYAAWRREPSRAPAAEIKPFVVAELGGRPLRGPAGEAGEANARQGEAA